MTTLRINGMTCANCARHVTEAILTVPGVRSAAVSLEKKNAAIEWTGDENVPATLKAISAAGYDASEMESNSCGCGACHETPSKNWPVGLWLGVFVTVILMAGEWIFGLMMTPWFRWLSFLLAGGVQVIAGGPFYRGAWRQLKAGRSNMDTLVALGSTTAFGYSVWVLLAGGPGEIYFMEAAAIITFVTIGHHFEARASEKAGIALKSLMQLAPQTARRLSPNKPGGEVPSFDLKTASFGENAPTPAVAEETEIPVAELKSGDLIALRPGDRVPVDGTVVDGESVLDESTLTGESVPVDKKSGGDLFAGTVNLNGRLVMRVTATGATTALAHVIAAVQRAQNSRADIQRLGDRVSSVFVPVVVVIAIVAGLWWGLAQESATRLFVALAPHLWPAHPYTGTAAGFIVAASVLIIACPCAMGLATPAAIMAAANAAARRGILVRDGIALEKAGRITSVIFDKTGTLTAGKPEVMTFTTIGTNKTVFRPAGNAEKTGDTVQFLLSTSKLAAALARHSTHPVSQAIGRLTAGDFEMKEWREIAGAGIEALVLAANGDWKTVRLGSLRWFAEARVDLTTGEKFITEHSAQGATIVGLVIDDALSGLFAIKDSLKPGARDVVAQLQRQHLKVFLFTGDNTSTAKSIALALGIPEAHVFAEVRPEQKAALVKKLQADGERAAFVGDGINDAPALTQADLGIAVSRASDIAREAADIILLKSEIRAVPEAIELARRTLRVIKQNLFWAFFYNALGIPLAALGFISPVFCAIAMGASDLVVIGNALRLLKSGKK